MSKTRWFDRNGVEIYAGDTVVDVYEGKQEKVYACHSADDIYSESLGINASNERFLELHPECCREIYPFTNFAYTMVKGERHLTYYEKVV